MKTRKKDTKFNVLAKKVMIFSFVVFVLGFVFISSVESDLNIKYQKVEKEIATIESDIDGLNMKKQELESFTRVASIASENGCTYQHTTTAAVAIGVHRE